MSEVFEIAQFCGLFPFVFSLIMKHFTLITVVLFLVFLIDASPKTSTEQIEMSSMFTLSDNIEELEGYSDICASENSNPPSFTITIPHQNQESDEDTYFSENDPLLHSKTLHFADTWNSFPLQIARLAVISANLLVFIVFLFKQKGLNYLSPCLVATVFSQIGYILQSHSQKANDDTEKVVFAIISSCCYVFLILSYISLFWTVKL